LLGFNFSRNLAGEAIRWQHHRSDRKRRLKPAVKKGNITMRKMPGKSLVIAPHPRHPLFLHSALAAAFIFSPRVSLSPSLKLFCCSVFKRHQRRHRELKAIGTYSRIILHLEVLVIQVKRDNMIPVIPQRTHFPTLSMSRTQDAYICKILTYLLKTSLAFLRLAQQDSSCRYTYVQANR